MLLPRLLPLLALSSLPLPLQAAEFVRAFGTFPADVSPCSIVTGADGYLYGISATDPNRSGATYRVASDKGKFELTHQFPASGNVPNFTRGGSIPDQIPLLGRDGCTYGFAKHGGLFGHGVIFQIRPDRDYAAIDLDPSQLLPDLPIAGSTFVDSLSGLFEGPDRAFYSYHLAGALIRIGRDGVITKVADIAHPGTALLNFADPLSSDRIYSVSSNLTGSGSNRIHLLQIRLSDGAILKEVSSADFSANPNLVSALPSDSGLLVSVADGSSTTVSSRLYRLEDSGAMIQLATFGWPDNPALPPKMHKFIHATTDGSIYYSTSSQRSDSIAVQDGRTLVELKPDGSFRTICGFGDAPMFNVVEMAGSLYGATYGKEVYVPKNQAGYQEEWISPANAANYTISKTTKKGGFHFQVALGDPALLNAPPVVNADFGKVPYSGVVIVRPLRNDRDPEHHGLRILDVPEPTHGHLSPSSDSNLVSCFIMDNGKTSSIGTYHVIDKQSQVATGVILLRGAPGNYRDEGLLAGRRPLTILIKPSGNLHATVPSGSGGDVVTVSGRLDWNDEGFAGIRLPSGQVVTFHVAITGGHGTRKMANYRIRQVDGTIITGTAPDYFGH
ncbi:choice-of-anchor tandem repeat GloVer-containing protein [Haloferula sp. BvORR071]|uniref:choice-of-anchor tandem repeat GloVer-containing protein n=1 Tax=Haloferula sp. BvORR071 TaxID=1396141 RepID=UPI00054EEA53|nr:choice-of-anchor tandem repeat GloVer-containing protein [Haloferula sp. BvORR071]